MVVVVERAGCPPTDNDDDDFRKTVSQSSDERRQLHGSRVVVDVARHEKSQRNYRWFVFILLTRFPPLICKKIYIYIG